MLKIKRYGTIFRDVPAVFKTQRGKIGGLYEGVYKKRKGSFPNSKSNERESNHI